MITLNRAQLNHLQSQVEDEGRNYWALLLVTLSVCMVSGNVLVIMSVVKERALQNMTNYFIVSLASADLLVAGLVMPFTIYALVSCKFLKKWQWKVNVYLLKYPSLFSSRSILRYRNISYFKVLYLRRKGIHHLLFQIKIGHWSRKIG